MSQDTADLTQAPNEVFGIDISTLAEETVDRAVKTAVRKHVATVAEEAVSAALTPELVEALRNRAADAATQAVNEQIEAQDQVLPPAAQDGIEDAGAEAAPVPQLLYPSLDQWVEEFYTLIYARTPNSARTWCPKWWLHDEAVYRLQALWMSWEYTRVNDGAVAAATWLVNWADPISAQLTAGDGCFKGCNLSDGHRAHDQLTDNRLPCDPAPPQLSQPRE